MTVINDREHVRETFYKPVAKFLANHPQYNGDFLVIVQQSINVAIDYNYHRAVIEEDLLTGLVLIMARKKWWNGAYRDPSDLPESVEESIQENMSKFEKALIKWLQANYRSGFLKMKPLREKEDYIKRLDSLCQRWQASVR